jgi:predicted site-specific integrase-resolvase
MAEQGYVPAVEASEAAGVELSTLHRWIQKGDLLGSKVGNHWYIQAMSLLGKYAKTPLEARMRSAIAACGAVLRR